MRSGFDRLARVYHGLEVLAFGRALERARFAFLDRLSDRERILVLGEGDGRCLERLVEAAPKASIVCVDASAAMLERARRRLVTPHARARVEFVHTDLTTFAFEPLRFDAVVTFFVLDCFPEDVVATLVDRIATSLRPGAPWLWADFVLPAKGFARLRARIWLRVLYGFFRIATRIPARRLPATERLLQERGFHSEAAANFSRGLVRSAVWRADLSAARPR